MKLTRLAFLAVIVGYSFASVFHIPLDRVENEEKLLPNDHLPSFNRYERSPSTASQPLTNYGNTAYIGNITIGTPPQTFRVLFDMLQSITWIPDRTCAGAGPAICPALCKKGAELCKMACDPRCCLKVDNDEPEMNTCEGKALFYSDASTTYVSDGNEWTVTMTNGVVMGFFGKDVVRFGTEKEALTIPSATFGQSTDMPWIFAGKPVDGILALASYPWAGAQPILVQANEAGLLDEPVFTVWLREKSVAGSDGGMFTYGGVDDTHCGPVIDYRPFTSPYLYQYEVSQFSLGSFSTSGKWQVVSDSVMPYIAGPKSVTDSLAKAAGATYNSTYNVYFIDCDATFPPFTMGIGSMDYAIPAKQLIILHQQHNTCVLAFAAYESPSTGKKLQWILGEPFMRQFCHVVDFGRKRIGFATSSP
jgi:hypothetical protein